MSNVIAFLEQMGSNAALASQAPEDYAAAVDALGLDDGPRQALLARDANALNGLLGGRLQMIGFLFPADGDEKKDGEEQEDDGEEPTQDQPKESIRRSGAH